MAALVKINPDGKDYLVATGNGGRNNSGPSGKVSPYKLIQKKLADAAAGQTMVISCNDQNRGLGTMLRPPLPPKPKPHLVRQGLT